MRRLLWGSPAVMRAAWCMSLLSSLLRSQLCELQNPNIKTVSSILYDHYSYVGQAVFSVSISRRIYIYLYLYVQYSSTEPSNPVSKNSATVSTHTHSHNLSSPQLIHLRPAAWTILVLRQRDLHWGDDNMRRDKLRQKHILIERVYKYVPLM